MFRTLALNNVTCVSVWKRCAPHKLIMANFQFISASTFLFGEFNRCQKLSGIHWIWCQKSIFQKNGSPIVVMVMVKRGLWWPGNSATIKVFCAFSACFLWPLNSKTFNREDFIISAIDVKPLPRCCCHFGLSHRQFPVAEHEDLSYFLMRYLTEYTGDCSYVISP